LNGYAEDEDEEAVDPHPEETDEMSEADVPYHTERCPDGSLYGEEAEEVEEAEATVTSSPVESMIYGSPQAETYFRKLASGQHPVDDAVIDVDDLSARAKLVVRPLSSPEAYFRLPAAEPEPEASDIYTDQEDRSNASQAVARVASLLNDVHRRPDAHPVDVHADRMSEAIVASALFETVFLSASEAAGADAKPDGENAASE